MRHTSSKIKMAQWRVPFSPCRARSLLFICISLLTTSAALLKCPAAVWAAARPLCRLASRQSETSPTSTNGQRNQVLDLYLPEQPSDKPLPLMIWIHGGAWMGGSQANPPVLYLVSKGFAVASIQYRFSSDAIWPAQAYDCKAAIRFLRQRGQI